MSGKGCFKDRQLLNMNYSDDATIRQLIETNTSDLVTALNYSVFNVSVTSVQSEHSHAHCFNWKTKFVQKPEKDLWVGAG